MIQKPLYKYTDEQGCTIVSPNKPETEYTEMVRLIADEKMILRKGDILTFCTDIDVVDIENWTEEVDTHEDDNESEQLDPSQISAKELYDMLEAII